MSMPTLRLERYFFTESTVRANPQHTPGDPRRGSRMTPTLSCAPVEEQPSTFAVEMTVALDEARSENPPYFFTITAFAILAAEDNVPDDIALSIANTIGFNMLVGAIREHLAGVTARGPRGPFLFGPLRLTPNPGEPQD